MDAPSPLDRATELILSAVPVAGMTTVVVAVDGPGGSGKSTLAAGLASRLGGTVVHTDDFASWDEPFGWWPRMLDEVLLPLSRNEPARFRRRDWTTGTLADELDVAAGGVVILEGVSSSCTAFRRYLACAIWVDTTRAERLRRGLERDGQDAASLWATWMAQEDTWIADESPREHADLVVSGEWAARAS